MRPHSVPGRAPTPTRTGAGAVPTARATTVLALAVGVVGGIYGIGGGSILGPVLAGRGVPVATVAPAALASTFITSLVGAGTYAALALTTTAGDIAPDWLLGLSCGLAAWSAATSAPACSRACPRPRCACCSAPWHSASVASTSTKGYADRPPRSVPVQAVHDDGDAWPDFAPRGKRIGGDSGDSRTAGMVDGSAEAST